MTSLRFWGESGISHVQHLRWIARGLAGPVGGVSGKILKPTLGKVLKSASLGEKCCPVNHAEPPADLLPSASLAIVEARRAIRRSGCTRRE